MESSRASGALSLSHSLSIACTRQFHKFTTTWGKQDKDERAKASTELRGNLPSIDYREERDGKWETTSGTFPAKKLDIDFSVKKYREDGTHKAPL